MRLLMREIMCLGLAAVLLVSMTGGVTAKPVTAEMDAPGYVLDNADYIMMCWPAAGEDEKARAMEQAGYKDITGDPSQVMEMGLDRPMAAMGNPMDKTDEQNGQFSFHNWRGFALKDNESHALRISVNSIQFIDPMEVRRLLESNMTLQEIRSKIKEQNQAANRGGIRLGESIYPLQNIILSDSEGETILEADVVEPQFSDIPGEFEIRPLNETAIVGHLTLNPASENSEVIEGTLNIISTRHSGTFKLLVEETSKDRMMMGHRPGEFVED